MPLGWGGYWYQVNFLTLITLGLLECSSKWWIEGKGNILNELVRLWQFLLLYNETYVSVQTDDVGKKGI